MKKPRKGADYRTEQRWTPKLMVGGFTPVSDTFLRAYASLVPPVTTGEAMLIVQVMSYKWDERLPFPSLAKLEARMHCTERHIRNLFKSLEDKGYIKRIPRVGTSNEFDLSGLFRKLEAWLEADMALRREWEGDRLAVLTFPSAAAAGGVS